MKSRWKWLLLVLPLLVLVLGNVLAGDAPRDDDMPRDKAAKYMRMKLVHSQKLLEALATENFGQLERSSQELKLLSQESVWNVMQTDQYMQYSMDFRRRAEALTQAAKKKNLDGASMAFVELTLNCVQCHKYIRDVRQAKVEFPDMPIKPAGIRIAR